MKLRAGEFQHNPRFCADRIELTKEAAADVSAESCIDSRCGQQMVGHGSRRGFAGRSSDANAAATIEPLGEEANLGCERNPSVAGGAEQRIVPGVWNGRVYDDEIGTCEVGDVVAPKHQPSGFQSLGAVFEIFRRTKIGDGDIGPLIQQPAGAPATAAEGSEPHQEYPLASEFRHSSMVRTIHARMCDASPQPIIQKPPLSRLAVVGVVLAVIPFCLPLNLIGSVIGVIAKRRIAVSDGRLGGRRAATVAIWGGLIMTLAGWWAWSAAGNWADRAMKQSVSETATDFLADIAEGNTAASLRFWAVNSAPPTDASLDQFAQGFAALGAVQGVGIKSMQPVASDNPLQPRWSAWLVVTAGGKQWDGSAEVDIVAGGGMFELRATLTQIVITGPEGDITLESGGADTPDPDGASSQP